MIAGRSRATTALWLTLMVALIAIILLCPLPRSWSTPWKSKILDLGHVPLFACICLFLRSATGWRWLHCVLLTSGAAVFGEIGQGFVSRSANVEDALRGIIGSLIPPVVARGVRAPRSIARIAGAMAMVTLLISWPLAEARPTLLDAWNAYWKLPILADFSDKLEMRRFHTRETELDRLPAKKNSKAYARITFRPSNYDYPTFEFTPPMNDWRGYEHLVFDLTVVGEPLDVTITVFDWLRKKNGYEERFEQTWHLPSGRQLWKLDLATMVKGPKTMPLDLSQIRWVQLYMTKPAMPRTILIHRIYLQ